MEEENNELEENFLSRWSKKKSKQKTQIENFDSKQTDPESSPEKENQSSLDEENEELKVNASCLYRYFVNTNF